MTFFTKNKKECYLSLRGFTRNLIVNIGGNSCYLGQVKVFESI
jgi:hypothetical protein